MSDPTDKDREAAESYALQRAIHLWERLPVRGPAGDYKEKPTRGIHGDVATFLAGIAHAQKNLINPSKDDLEGKIRKQHAEEVVELVSALELLEKELLRMTPVYSGLVICIQNSLRNHRVRVKGSGG